MNSLIQEERYQQLYQGAIMKKIKQKQRSKERKEVEMKDCTFRPQLVTESRLTNQLRLKKEKQKRKELKSVQRHLKSKS